MIYVEIIFVSFFSILPENCYAGSCSEYYHVTMMVHGQPLHLTTVVHGDLTTTKTQIFRFCIFNPAHKLTPKIVALWVKWNVFDILEPTVMRMLSRSIKVPIDAQTIPLKDLALLIQRRVSLVELQLEKLVCRKFKKEWSATWDLVSLTRNAESDRPKLVRKRFSGMKGDIYLYYTF